MMKRSWILTLLLATAGIVNAQELRIVTFSYPPYTSLETSAGLVEHRVNKAMTSRSITVNWEYFPLVRAFQEFLADGEAVFAGHIGQFSETDQKRLRYVTTMTTKVYMIVRADLAGQSLQHKVFVGLRHDNNLIANARKHNGQFVEINSMNQAFAMIALGRADVLVCLEAELEELQHYPNLVILREHTRTFELQLIYHDTSVAGEVVSRVARESDNFSW